MSGTTFALDDLRTFGVAAYERAGLTPADARTMVDVQLDADLRGVDTHGFQRLPWYVGYVRRGENAARPRMRMVVETPLSVVLDADNALGQLACVRLMELVLDRARDTGLAVGASRNSNDWGCGAYYPLMAAREGYVSFATTTSVPTLAPYGGKTRVLGNNPMVFAAPRRDGPPLVLDMALTPVALGKVMRAAAEGAEIPAEWGFRDADGRPTTDPRTALGGIIPAIGGYKGTGLSAMMNLLAGVLPLGHHSSDVGRGRRGQFMVVLSPDLLGERERFLDGVEAMCEEISGAERLPGEEVFLPGEPEWRRATETRRRGTITYPQSVVRELREVGEELGVEAPTPAG